MESLLQCIVFGLNNALHDLNKLLLNYNTASSYLTHYLLCLLYYNILIQPHLKYKFEIKLSGNST